MYDVLVIGSGIAGLTFAIKIAERFPQQRVLVLTKTEDNHSNTAYAQGGIAAVWNDATDNFAKHIADTHDAGDGLCNPEAVEIVVKEGPARVRELIEWGTRFDQDKTQTLYDLCKEGGHSENRILHYKDFTGKEIQRALLERVKQLPNVDIHEHYFAVDIITQHHLGHNITRLTPNIKCYGAYVLNKETNKVEKILAKVTMIATGGTGQIYRNTTNPSIATGDGIAMAYRAKAHVQDMEFVQFHPTALYNMTGENPDFLVSEAVRGFGGILKTNDGNEFMHKYDKRGSLAPRDIVARAIDNEMKQRGDDFVGLDCRHLDKAAFIAHFPTIYEKCMSLGINPFERMIPVVPACHYMCGGIKVDSAARSSINFLYAAGECTCTGLHGANRLASNSLLEAIVYAHRAYLDVSEQLESLVSQKNIPDWDADGTTQPKELVLITQSIKELKEIMSSYVGIVRSNVRIKRAFDRLFLLFEETELLYQETTLSPQLCELRNMITIAYLVTKSAAMRKESRGLHTTTDYPQTNDFLDVTIL
jgi:L-aspartate oxidase